MTINGYPILAAWSTAAARSDTGSVVPGATGTPAADIRFRAAILSPMASMVSGSGPIQTSPAFLTWRARRGDRAGEVGVLRQEAVAGVHRLRAAHPGRLDDRLSIEVGLGR